MTGRTDDLLARLDWLEQNSPTMFGMKSDTAKTCSNAAAQIRSDAQQIMELARRDNWHKVCKEICEEWNEDCDPECDSVSHTETCKAVFIAQAKRALRERAEEAERQLKELQNATK